MRRFTNRGLMAYRKGGISSSKFERRSPLEKKRSNLFSKVRSKHYENRGKHSNKE